MDLKKALAILSKKFVLNGDAFKTCSKATIIRWAEQVVQQGSSYKTTRNQHAWLISDLALIPVDEKGLFEF